MLEWVHWYSNINISEKHGKINQSPGRYKILKVCFLRGGHNLKGPTWFPFIDIHALCKSHL